MKTHTIILSFFFAISYRHYSHALVKFCSITASTLCAVSYVLSSIFFQPRHFKLGRLQRTTIICKWFGGMICCSLSLCAPSSLVSWDLSIIAVAAVIILIAVDSLVDALVMRWSILLSPWWSWGTAAAWAEIIQQRIHQTHEDSHNHSFLLHNIITALMLWHNAAPSLYVDRNVLWSIFV